MTLSRVALLCLESSSYFKNDILFARDAVNEVNRERYERGEFRDLYKQYRKCPDKFYEYTRMSVDTFDYILENIEEHFHQILTSKRVVTVPEKLFLTLRYLAHGTSFQSLSNSYRLGRSTVAKTIYQTLKALWKAFSQLHMPKPTERNLKRVSDEFLTKWEFPNCIGSIDGKFFRIKHVKKFSLVLQAISNADYRFIAIEVVGKGHQTDNCSFHISNLNKSLNNNQFNVPPPNNLPGTNLILPHVLVGDETYPLKTYLMRPYPPAHLNIEKEIFNKRLARARVTIERAFGIFSKKWRIFMKAIETNTKHAKLLIKVACVLHNIVRQMDGNNDKDFREYMDNLSNYKNKKKRSKRNNRAASHAIAIRDQYKKYFVNNPITIM